MTRDKYNRTIRFLLVLLALLGVAVIAVGWKWRLAHEAALEEQARAVDRVRLGGPFTLVDHHGRTVTEADFEGKFLLLFFGYTSCPDVCPMTLKNISRALDLLDGRTGRLAPLFVSVDPARDTPPVMADYLTNFHGAITGLTGGADQLAAMARAYGIFSQPLDPGEDDGADGHEGQAGDGAGKGAGEGTDGDYYMEHSSTSLLMGPDGTYIAHFPLGTSPEDMAATIREALGG